MDSIFTKQEIYEARDVKVPVIIFTSALLKSTEGHRVLPANDTQVILELLPKEPTIFFSTGSRSLSYTEGHSLSMKILMIMVWGMNLIPRQLAIVGNESPVLLLVVHKIERCPAHKS
jgi:hypothetical protein